MFRILIIVSHELIYAGLYDETAYKRMFAE